MDIVTIKTLDKQAQEEDDNKIKFFEEGLWVYRKNKKFYLYEIYEAYLEEKESKTNKDKQKIVFEILDRTGKGSILTRQIDGCKSVYKLLVKCYNRGLIDDIPQFLMLEEIWKNILQLADSSEEAVIRLAERGELFDNEDNNYKDKYTNQNFYKESLDSGNEYLRESNEYVRNPFYHKPLVRAAIDEIINRNINKYTDIFNEHNSKKGGKKSRKQRIKSKRTGKSIKHNKK